MDNWFTIEQIDDNTFTISENKHWEETHCYLLCGSEKAILIDTGLGVDNIKSVIDKLTVLPIEVLTTHAHWDHIGGHRYFDNISIHEAEKSWLSEKFPLPLNTVKNNLLREPCNLPLDFSADNFQIYKVFPQRILHDHDKIDIGNRCIEVIHTPGHSPGHCCFYETDRQYLFSGDLIYKGCLDAFYPTTDPILFADSVDKIRILKVNRLFPGHHNLDISVALIDKIHSAFTKLKEDGELRQGSGIYEFEGFQIHI